MPRQGSRIGELVINEQEDLQTPPPSRGLKDFIVRHWKGLLVVLVIVLLMIGFAMYLRHKQPIAPPAGGRFGQNGPVAVAVATAVAGDIQVKIPALGTVTPLANVTVQHADQRHHCRKIYFTEGQLVHQGRSVGADRSPSLRGGPAADAGQPEARPSAAGRCQVGSEALRGLVKEDSIAQQQLDTQRALVDQYVGTIESDEGQVKTAQVNLIYTHIVSPVTGRVGLRQVDQGNYVTPGDTNGIVVINQLQPITVIFPMPEDNVSAVMKRVREGAQLTVEAYDRTNSTKIADGKLLTARQHDRRHHRHGQAARAIRQRRRFAVSESVRQYSAAVRTCSRIRSSCPTPRCAAARPMAWHRPSCIS